MCKMRRGTALAPFLAVVVFPLLLECTTTCQMGSQDYHVEGLCPVKVTPVLFQEPGGMYSPQVRCVTVRVWMKANDLSRPPKIEILAQHREIFRPILNKKRIKQGETKVKCLSAAAQQLPHRNTSVWEFVNDCVMAEAGSNVTVSYSTASTSCSVSYTVPDPIPEFDLSVNRSSKSITVTAKSEHKVLTRWCYQKNEWNCIGGPPPTQINIDSSQPPSAVLNIPHLLPCVCIQTYYSYSDSRRHNKCPFRKERLTDVRDVWNSSEIVPFRSSLRWSSVCPVRDLNISASLCWKQHEHFCAPVLNSTLEGKEEGTDLIYNTSTVDKHPKMCVQFSLQGSHNIFCPFQTAIPSWEVHIGPGKQSVFVYLTSSDSAVFSAQLCVLSEMGCSPMGPVHTIRMEGNTTEARINMPPHFLAQKPCVQVWQSDPTLHGRRILCLDYTHNRCGLYGVAALILVSIVAFFGIIIHRLTKSGAAGWLYIQKPVLLVCSSERTAHISAVCALASILQGELSATVHMALWAQSSQSQSGARTGVADLGPLPWLYGQWETVRKAQGKVLIIWSPEAKTTYEKWKGERAEVDKEEGKKEDDSKAARHEKIRADVEENYKLNARRLGKCKKEKAAGRTDRVKLCDDEDCYPQKEPSSVIAPVFVAALARLQGTLQQRKGQGVAIVYFQGHGHSREIPKALRGVPRYCLPQDFRGLIQELGGMKRETQTGKFWWPCCPRLLSKVQSVWLARQLAGRLQTLLPQTPGKKVQGLTAASSQKTTSEETQGGLKLPRAANAERAGTEQEQEPLHGSPWRAETL